MEIVKARENHIPDLLRLLLQVELVHHAIRPDIFRNGAMKYTKEELQQLLQDPAKPVFVAEEQGQVLGYCFCQLRELESSVFKPRRELYIDDICVDSAFRRRGIATALCRHTQDYAKAHSCGYVSLNVWQGNDAAKFYEHLGFRPRNVMMEMHLEDLNAE